jgi:protein-S-isoprenylcysteine O-methyltransferase Ste14
MGNVTVRLILFVAASALLLYASRKSLKAVRSHGFYRFFAWEAILGLILLNAPVWFDDPLSALQIASWFLLCVSAALVVLGVVQLRAKGKPGIQRHDDSLLAFENTSALVTTGIYRYIRHPMYSSLLFLAWGAFLKDVTWYSSILVVAATVLLIATGKADEAECKRHFGAIYEEYMKLTEMFIPFVA